MPQHEYACLLANIDPDAAENNPSEAFDSMNLEGEGVLNCISSGHRCCRMWRKNLVAC